MKPRLRAEELTGMISLLRDKFVRSENLRRCCFVPMRRNSVLDGLRSNLFKFIQERMSVKVVVSVSRHRAELVGVKEMYSWVSSAYKWYLRNFLRSPSREEFETLLFCANEKKFSFRWIEEQFVQVHPGKNVSESGGECFKT